jgi:hydroxyacylglutathione hydrolase
MINKMKWNQIPLGPLQTNCYVVENEEECVIIDPGGEGEKLIQHLQSKKWKPLAILLTHAHFDHIGAVDTLRDYYHIPVYIHEKEAKWLFDPALNGSQSFLPGQLIRLKPADQILTNETELKIGNFSFHLFETPGHSPGSVTYYLKEKGMIFSGDVLFQGSIGRTDLIGGNQDQLMKSIHTKLLVLPEDTIVLSGHGPITTLVDEMENNPFLNGF